MEAVEAVNERVVEETFKGFDVGSQTSCTSKVDMHMIEDEKIDNEWYTFIKRS